MNDFVIDEIVDLSANLNGRLYPLKRAEQLKREFATMFSGHLGRLKSGYYFEGEVLIVTGASGAGKTTEVEKLLREFNSTQTDLPNGKSATFATCVLDRKGTWKDLGKNTLHSMGFPVSDSARMTQGQIGRRVRQQGALHGVVGIWYDEAQHILAHKKQEALEEVLDCFKTMVKGPDWPMMLVMSGVPELADYIPHLEQLCRKVTHVSLDDVDFQKDSDTVNDVVGSYALEANLTVAEELLEDEFLHRLVTASAYRWGLVLELVMKAVGKAVAQRSAELNVEHFVQAWVSKTGMNAAATPFTHSGYVTMFRRDNPFKASIMT